MTTRLSTHLTTLAALALAAVTLGDGATAVAQESAEDAEQRRIHDVSDLTPSTGGRVAGYTDPEFAPLGFVRLEYLPEEIWIENFEERISPSIVAQQVGDLLVGILWETDINASFESLASGRFALETSDEGHSRADAALALLRRQAPAEIRVEFRSLTVPQSELSADVIQVLERVANGTLDAADEQRLTTLDGSGGSERGELVMEAAWWSVLRQVRSIRCVADVSVEIAQHAAISDPVCLTVRDGLRVACLPRPLLDGRVALRVVAFAGAVEQPFRRVNLGQSDNGSLELPDFRGVLAATEIVLTGGRSAGLVMWRPDGAARVLLVKLANRAPVASGGTLGAFSIAAASLPSPEFRVNWAESTDWEVPLGVSLTHLEESGGGALDADFVVDELKRSIREEFDGDRAYESRVQWAGGPLLVVRASSAAVDKVRSRLAELEQLAVQPVHVSVRLEERGPAGRTRVVGQLGAPAAVGANLAFGAYRSVAFVADQDVEVAEGSSISDPVVREALAGLLANARVTRSGDGYSLEIELRVTSLDGEPRQIAHSADGVGLVERVASRSRDTEARLQMTPGEPREIVLGSSPFADGAYTLIAVLRVSHAR